MSAIMIGVRLVFLLYLAAGRAEAKGVAGMGKVGGDAVGGSDKAGQQVPPEVYIALTYAGTAFLFTLSVPLILYGLNKLLNKIEDCFGCGPSSRKAKQCEEEQAEAETKANAKNIANHNHNHRNKQDYQQLMFNQQLHMDQQAKLSMLGAVAGEGKPTNLTPPQGNQLQLQFPSSPLSSPVQQQRHPQQYQRLNQEQDQRHHTAQSSPIIQEPNTNHNSSTVSAITLPFGAGLNYKMTPMEQSQQAPAPPKHPYIISSPYL